MRNEDQSISYVSMSHETGLQIDDRFLSVDDTKVFSDLDLVYIFNTINSDEAHTVVVKRNGEKVRLENVVFKNTADGGLVDFCIYGNKKNPLTVIKGSGERFMTMSHVIGLSLKQLFTGKMKKDDVSGPVGVVSVISETAEQSRSVSEAIENILYLMALITINVGIFNLLPIPGLDGGRLMIYIVEVIRRRKIPPEIEGMINLAGFALIMLLGIFIAYNDILKIIRG